MKTALDVCAAIAMLSFIGHGIAADVTGHAEFIITSITHMMLAVCIFMLGNEPPKRRDFGSRARLDGERAARHIHAAGV